MSKLTSLRSMGPTGKEVDNISRSPSGAMSLLGDDEIIESFLLGVPLALPALLDHHISMQEPN